MIYLLIFAGIVCRQLQNPKNGVVTQKAIPYVGSVAVYTCNDRFELNGNSKRVCQSNGLYSGAAPVCVGKYYCAVSFILFYSTISAAIVCDRLNDINNGDVAQHNPALIGSVAVYTCNRGFKLVGPSRRVCLRDGSYTDREPVCVGK